MHNDSNRRMEVWYVSEGQLTKTDVSGTCYGEVTINSDGTQLTLKGTNIASTIYYTNFVIVQLD